MPEPTNPSPQPEPNEKLVKIFDTEQENEAIVVQGLLESAGIETVLVDDNTVRSIWFISNLVGGIKLCVREQDEEAALEVLGQPTPTSIEVDGVGSYDQPACPQCRSLDISFQAVNRPVAYGSAAPGVPIPLKRERWKCNQCGHHWVNTANSSNAGWEEA